MTRKNLFIISLLMLLAVLLSGILLEPVVEWLDPQGGPLTRYLVNKGAVAALLVCVLAKCGGLRFYGFHLPG